MQRIVVILTVTATMLTFLGLAQQAAAAGPYQGAVPHRPANVHRAACSANTPQLAHALSPWLLAR